MKIRFKGEGRFVDADPYVHASINCESGEVIDVSTARALELLALPDFEAVDPVPEPPRDPEPMVKSKATK